MGKSSKANKKESKKKSQHKKHKKHKKRRHGSSSSSDSSSDSDSGGHARAGSALSQLERERAAVQGARYLLATQQAIRKSFREVSSGLSQLQPGAHRLTTAAAAACMHAVAVGAGQWPLGGPWGCA